MKSIRCVVLLGIVTIAFAGVSSAEGPFEYRGWGVRAGVATDPDQGVIGLQWDLGEVAERLRFEPSLELGFGDDHTVLTATGPVHYLFDVDAKVQPYAGGGLALAYLDRDLPPNSQGDDSDLELGVKIIGGVEWQLRGDNSFRIEAALHAGDIYDGQVMAVWAF